MSINEYYGIALMLSEHKNLMCCLLQMGTGNTKETSNLVERWFLYESMKDIITNINEENYVTPEQFFRVKIIEDMNVMRYEFYKQEKTPELVSLFEKPDYFEDLDTSFLG